MTLKRIQWNTYKTCTLIPIQGWEDWEQKLADITGHDLQWSAQQRKAKQSSDMQSHVSPCSPGDHPAQAWIPGAQLLTL